MRLEDEASTTDVTSQGPSLQCEDERERQGAVAAAETSVFEGPGRATLAKKPLACKPRGRMLSHHRASGLVAASESAHVQSSIQHPPLTAAPNRCSTRWGAIKLHPKV